MYSEHPKIIAIHTQETRRHKLTLSALLCMGKCKSLGSLKLFLWDAFEVGNGWGSLACCSPLGSKESDTTE